MEVTVLRLAPEHDWFQLNEPYFKKVMGELAVPP